MAPTLSALTALAAVSAASAFQPSPPTTTTTTQRKRPPPYPPRHHNPRYYADHPRRLPRYSVALDAEIISEADERMDEMREEEEWLTDKERAMSKNQQQQVGEAGNNGNVNFVNPHPPSSEPLKNAAASYPSDTSFQGRKPGQPVNRSDNHNNLSDGDFDDFSDRAIVTEKRSNRDGDSIDSFSDDPREQHVVLDEGDSFMNDFFQPSSTTAREPPRSGPAVYTREEEDLISAMGGRGQQQQQQQQRPDNDRYNNPMIPPPPPFGQPPPQNFREEGYLGDSTLKEISLDYSIPIPYLADVLATWGTPVPIDPNMRLGDMVTGEQAFAVLEAIHTLDIAALHNMYSEETLMNICDYYDINVKEAFEFCVGRGWGLPFGVRTFLRVEQEEDLIDALGGDGY